MKFTKQIQDPIWGSIRITDLEEQIMRTSAFSRLKHIKQMGLAFLDFPGLNHTRFEHSIGVMYVADRLYMILNETRKKLRSRQLDAVFNVNSRQAVRLAALLHDIGHPPFSHAVELTFIKYPSLLEKAKAGTNDKEKKHIFSRYSHEEFTKYLIRNDSDIKRIIKDSPELHFSTNEIAGLAVGKAEVPLSAFNQIISGDFDADRIDYLIRDNHHSGFRLGLTPDELYGSVHLRLLEDNLRNPYEIYVDRRAIPFVNALLTARNNLINRVHLAPFGRAATQRLTGFLYQDLIQAEPKRLQEIIFEIHSICNDFTFFKAIGRQAIIPDTGKKKSVLEDILIGSLWKPYAQLDYIHMHPCLRLLSYLVARSTYTDLQDHIFNDAGNSDANIWVEPSTRPAPKFSLMVDYNCNPISPSLDYIAGTENEPARAILSSALSNISVYGYVVDKSYPSTTYSKNGESKYLERMNDQKEKKMAQFIIYMAKTIKNECCEHNAFSTEFILSVLYHLEQHIIDNFESATNIYVYRGEYFCNIFLRSMISEDCFPDILRSKNGGSVDIDINRVFNDIVRLEAFGLVESKRIPIYHSKKRIKERISRRNRFGIFGLRSEFRISPWGKHYVEAEINEVLNSEVRGLINGKQNNDEILSEFKKIGNAVCGLCERPKSNQNEPYFHLKNLERFYRILEDSAKIINRKNACVMTFCNLHNS